MLFDTEVLKEIKPLMESMGMKDLSLLSERGSLLPWILLFLCLLSKKRDGHRECCCCFPRAWRPQ